MKTISLLIAASVIVLSAPGAVAARTPLPVFSGKHHAFRMPKHAKLLYSQNSNDSGHAVNSENFTDGSFSPTYNDAGADDFVVPKHAVWTILEVDAAGVYYNGYGPATSEDITFYKDKNRSPGKPVKMFVNLNGTDDRGSLYMVLPGSGLTLHPGHYWVSVVPNMDILCCGEWGWELSSVQHKYAAMWENPVDGFGTGCTTWDKLKNCVGYSGDFMFDLQGEKSKYR